MQAQVSSFHRHDIVHVAHRHHDAFKTPPSMMRRYSMTGATPASCRSITVAAIALERRQRRIEIVCNHIDHRLILRHLLTESLRLAAQSMQFGGVVAGGGLGVSGACECGVASVIHFLLQ